MNHFRLFAIGEAFDVDAFLAKTTLRPDAVVRRGTPRRFGKHPKSMFDIVLGDGQSLSLSEQEEIAVSFLKANREELRQLAAFPGIEAFVLGIQDVPDFDESVVGFCITPSADLMWHALDVGVALTYYVSLRHYA
jgi:hypothetical protein